MVNVDINRTYWLFIRLVGGVPSNGDMCQTKCGGDGDANASLCKYFCKTAKSSNKVVKILNYT